VRRFFLRFRERVIKSYPTLFGDQDKRADFDEQSQFNTQWGWYNSIYQLAKGDVQQFDAVTRLPLKQTLTYLTYETQKARIEKRMMEKSLRR
jgi:hypothetical protein